METQIETFTPATDSDWFSTDSVSNKLRDVEDAVTAAFKLTSARRDYVLGRDLRVVDVSELPPKPGLSTALGQARLLHDLANIELQAMELAVRGLYEFPEAPHEFRLQLAEIALSESRHLKLCLRGLEGLGFKWGDWPVHLALWNTVGSNDTLIDRILLVHRYLEGSGIDAGESILRRLVGAGNKPLRATVQIIVTEEVDHVRFGSHWYRKIAGELGLDPERDFSLRMGGIIAKAPRRDRLARELRLKAGFSDYEMDELERLRD